jgi:hypothetical protein
MSIAKRIETATIATIACAAIIISILDLTGALDGVAWLRNRVPVLTLLVVGAFAGYLIAERSLAARDLTSTLQAAIQQAVAASSGIEVRSFQTQAEFWLYAAERIRTCTATIDDLTWGPKPKTAMTSRDLNAYEEYRKQIKLSTTGKGEGQTKTYREIMSFPDNIRFDRAMALMDPRYRNYHLRYYDYDHGGSPLLLQFSIFDNTEVLISSGVLDVKLMSFKSKHLVEIMSHYFDVVWRDAIVLKDTQTVDLDRLKEVARRQGVFLT